MNLNSIIPRYGFRIDLVNILRHYLRDVFIYVLVVVVFILIEETVYRISRIHVFILANFIILSFSIAFEFGNGISFKKDGNRSFFDPVDIVSSLIAFLPVVLFFIIIEPDFDFILAFFLSEFLFVANCIIFIVINLFLIVANLILGREFDLLAKEKKN